MRVLILNDRVHENNDSLTVLKSFCDGIDPPHEIAWVNIHELSMHACTKCDKCHPCGECVLPEDDAHEISRLMFVSDALVVGLDSSLDNLSPAFRILLDRCLSAISFQNRQGKTCPWRKGRPAVIVSLERSDSKEPRPNGIIDNSLSQTLELGGFKTIDTLTIPLRDHASPEVLLIAQARSIGCRLSRALS